MVETVLTQCPSPIAFSARYCERCLEHNSENIYTLFRQLDSDRTKKDGFDNNSREWNVSGYINGHYLPMPVVDSIYRSIVALLNPVKLEEL